MEKEETRNRSPETQRRTDLDGGVDGVADEVGVDLPGAEPDGGHLGAGAEDEAHYCHLSRSGGVQLVTMGSGAAREVASEGGV
jgi:hypothetical protein